MEDRPTSTLLVFLIDGRQGRGVEMTPLEGPEGSGGSIGALGSVCVFLTGSLIHTGGRADTGVVHTGIILIGAVPGRMTLRFPAVDEHTVSS